MGVLVQRNVILHIEDNAMLAGVVATGLKAFGYKMSHAPSAEEGLRKIKILRPDLIILDLNMPGMGGTLVLRQLAKPGGGTTIPVLVFTAFSGMLTEEIKKYAAGLILKPAGIDKVLQEVERILGPQEGTTPSAGAFSKPAPAVSTPEAPQPAAPQPPGA